MDLLKEIKSLKADLSKSFEEFESSNGFDKISILADVNLDPGVISIAECSALLDVKYPERGRKNSVTDRRRIFQKLHRVLQRVYADAHPDFNGFTFQFCIKTFNKFFTLQFVIDFLRGGCQMVYGVPQTPTDGIKLCLIPKVVDEKTQTTADLTLKNAGINPKDLEFEVEYVDHVKILQVKDKTTGNKSFQRVYFNKLIDFDGLYQSYSVDMGDGAMKQEAKLGTLYRGKKVVDHKDNKKKDPHFNPYTKRRLEPAIDQPIKAITSKVLKEDKPDGDNPFDDDESIP